MSYAEGSLTFTPDFFRWEMPYPRPRAPAGVPNVWKCFGTGVLMCSWCGVSEGRIVDAAEWARMCPRCPMGSRKATALELERVGLWRKKAA